MAIIRAWKAKARLEKFPDYARHLRERVVPQLSKLEGYRDITLLRRDLGEMAEIRVLTRWDSMEAIRQFAGDNPEIAVVEPEAEAVLVEFDRHVMHFEVVF